ncbi:MAG: M20/M25/M40 family metallo-hydrolase [Candidatus Cloacimonetes bacterium]|nr:M20/M25/M40 family metallo-hydrolase [Candidatus Cloacimonadota bacterium]
MEKNLLFMLVLLIVSSLLIAQPVLVKGKAADILSGDRCLYQGPGEVLLVIEQQSAATRQMEIVDYNYRVGVYYLVRAEGVTTADPAWGRLICRIDNKFIIRNDQNPQLLIARQGYSCIHLEEINRAENIRHVPLESLRQRDEIDDIIALMNPDSIESVIQSLQDFGTRYCFHPNHLEVATWIMDKFASYGYDSGLAEFIIDDTDHYDVLAQVIGTVHPERVLLMGGHYDSIVNSGDPMLGAPGADDNASSVAAALEVARVISESGYQPRNTIAFCAFAAEEVGLWGSFVLASGLAEMGTNIDFVLNNDMIANNTQSPENWMMNIVQYTGYEYLRELSQELIPQYSSLSMGYLGENSASSDSYSFFVNGFPVVYFLETEFSPWYHSMDDIIDNCDIDYCTEITKVDCAMLLTMDMIPVSVENMTVYDTGDGTSAQLCWNQSTEPQFEEYKIYAGTESGIYEQEFTAIDTIFTVTGLTENIMAYLGVSVITSDGFESFITETVIMPQSLPRPPQNFCAAPATEDIILTWTPNQELDLAGYNIFRRAETETEFSMINISLVSDTVYMDHNILPLVYYHYYTQAIDLDGNSGDASSEVISRMATLDQGILLVDLTLDLGAGFGNPDPAEWQQFYQSALTGFAPDIYDLEIAGILPDYELVTYSTIILVQDRSTTLPGMPELLPALEKYQELGGNIVLSGFRVINDFFDCSEFPCTFEEEHPANRMFGIQQVDYSQNARFLRAQPLATAFQLIEVDPVKTIAYFENHLPFIETYSPTPGADSLYIWESNYEDGTNFGMMNGRNVAVCQDNGISKTALLAFPLYYMQSDDVREFYSMLLQGFMGEETGINDENLALIYPSLYGNYPNPFNPQTAISFALPQAAEISLNIYNLKGQKVKTLAKGYYVSGKHLLNWQGDDDSRNPVASGIYFYKLQADGISVSSKMVLLK